MKPLFCFFILLFVFACSETPQQNTPLHTVELVDFSINVEGFGEIQASQAQKILSPGRRPMVLAWLHDENSYVEKGDVIARFDAERIQRQSREEELELLKLEQDILKSAATQEEQQRQVSSDQAFVDYEFDFVDRFAIDDLRIYSQLEIIDTFAKRDFLEAKDEFLDWKESSVNKQHRSQMAVLDIKKSGVDAKYQQFQQALSSLEVISPYSGLLIYEKDRRGEKPSVGQTIFPGRTIAQIPNLDDMQASIYVQANNAIDLAQGQSVIVTLDAFPQQQFDAEITKVSGFPRSIQRGNPITYFEVIAKIFEQNQELMQPGRKLTAQIKVKSASSKLAIPLQTLMHEQSASYVYVKNGKHFEKRPVSLGRKNLYMVEITDGLEEGEQIALSVPNEQHIRQQP